MKIVGVGCGPGMLTEQAIREISRASVIYGSDRAIDLAKSSIPPGCTVKTIDDFKHLDKLPDNEIVLVGSRIGEALGASTGEVVLFGLPALILRFINPDLLDGTGYETIEEFAASPGFHPAMQSSLAKFKKEYPHVRVVLVNRDGLILGESP
jgi:hypothetical protein